MVPSITPVSQRFTVFFSSEWRHDFQGSIKCMQVFVNEAQVVRCCRASHLEAIGFGGSNQID